MSPVADHAAVIARRPAWSCYLTRPMARWIPAGRRSAALTVIKGIHTAIFFSVFAAVVLTVSSS